MRKSGSSCIKNRCDTGKYKNVLDGWEGLWYLPIPIMGEREEKRMKKRKDSFGRTLPDGVSQRADGRYIYRYQKYGRPHYIYDRDLNKLKEKILQLQVNVVNGVNTDYKKMTLNEWYPQYLQIYKEGKIKQGSLINMKNNFKWYVAPYDLGHMPVCDIKRPYVVAHFQYLADEKNLARGTLGTLASMLQTATQEIVYAGGISVNPFQDIMKNIATKPKIVREALTEEEQKRLIEFLKTDGFQKNYLPIIGILLGTGMRYGECTALTWNDVDMKNKVIHINKTMNYRVRVEGGAHEYYVTTPKTKNAYRDLPMSSDVVKLFQIQKEYQKNMRIRQDIEIPEYNTQNTAYKSYKGFVFTSKLGYPITHEGIVASLKRIVAHCNEEETMQAEEEGRTPVLLPEKLTPHVFRHTVATRLVEQKISYENLKSIMGHASVRTSIDVYTSISKKLESNAREDLEKMSNIF